MSDDRKAIQELTERYTAKELAAAYLKASRRAKEAERKGNEHQKKLVELQLKNWTRSMGGLGL